MKYVLIILAVLLALGSLLSCGTRDDRNDIRAQYGDPSAIRRTGVDPFWSETWFYGRQGLAFEFRRTSGCGSARDVYLYVSYPIPIDTTAAGLAKPNAGPGAQKHFEKILSPTAPY
jgi:hypothetical protein